MPGSKARCLRTAWASWPGSAAHLCPPLGALPVWGPWGRGVLGELGRSHCRERMGWGACEGLGLSRSIFISASPPLPLPLVFQTVSINKAINTQEVAVKEKHARNILLDVAWKTNPEARQMAGTEVRARCPCSAAERGTPTVAGLLQVRAASVGSSWPLRPQLMAGGGGTKATSEFSSVQFTKDPAPLGTSL